LRTFAVAIFCLAVLLAYFARERRSLEKIRSGIPLRIAVTGTRGKSSVVRLAAAALRASGRRVLAKTTGSKPVLIHPDGSEHEIVRKGPPNLLEGKALLRAARGLGADTLVSELMSIHPEYLRAESRLLLKPTLLAVTNVRHDHEDVLGRTRDEIALGLAASLRPGCAVFMLEEEAHPAVSEAAARLGSMMMTVPSAAAGSHPRGRKERRSWDFEENTRLASALASACGVDSGTARKAMATARPDSGAFRVWKIRVGNPPRSWRCAAAFAANEPESTEILLRRLREAGLMRKGPRLALLNLREDRPDRTRQWLAAAGLGFFREFDELLIAGASRAEARLWKRNAGKAGAPLRLVGERRPESLMRAACGNHESGGLLFGAGNIGGMGRALVEYWEQNGVSLD
jgi:poly-gamma-glutamate synthase PgsB/CapB